ncbi:hypothetical protein [Pseudomonas cerasi]
MNVPLIVFIVWGRQVSSTTAKSITKQKSCKDKILQNPKLQEICSFLFDGSTAGAVLGVICRIWLLPEEGAVWELALVIVLYKCEPKSSLGFEAR